MKKGRSNPQTKPGPNTLAGKTGETIRLVIRSRPDGSARYVRPTLQASLATGGLKPKDAV